MANIKISELTALTPPDAADLLPVVDSSANQTKRTTVGEVVGIINGDVEVATDGTATISELPVSKLQDGAARQLLQTDAAGTGVEWTSNVDVPGTLDVTGAATFDSSVAVTGALTKSGSNVVTVGDTGTVTSTMLLDGTIVNGDINASAAIAGTKISPDFGSQTVTTTGVFSADDGTAAAPGITFTGDTNTGLYSPGADQVAISTNGTGRLFVDSAGTIGIGAQGEASLSADTKQIKVGGLSYFRGTNGTSGKQNFYCGISYNAAPTSFNGDKAIVSNTSSDYLPAQYAMFLGTHVWRTATAATAGSAITWNERMRLTNAGRLGLGTSSPSALAHLANTSSTAGYNFLQITAGGESQVHTVKSTLSTGRDLELNTARTLKITTGSNTGSFASEGHIQFSHGTNGDLVRIAADGKVGIGTTSPEQILDVRGVLQIKNAGTTTLRFNDSTTNYWDIQNDSNLRFSRGGSEFARIDSSGRLLVGTSSDSGGSLLQVNDNRIRIATAKTPASASDTGTAGEICWDADYIYVCTATDTWKRTAISTW
jgi:hypothetical protein